MGRLKWTDNCSARIAKVGKKYRTKKHVENSQNLWNCLCAITIKFTVVHHDMNTFPWKCWETKPCITLMGADLVDDFWPPKTMDIWWFSGNAYPAPDLRNIKSVSSCLSERIWTYCQVRLNYCTDSPVKRNTWKSNCLTARDLGSPIISTFERRLLTRKFPMTEKRQQLICDDINIFRIIGSL